MSEETSGRLTSGRGKPPADPAIYRAINPRWNITLREARELRAGLARLGFPLAAIVCHPQGDGKGWGWVQEVTEAELVEAGIGPDDAVHLLFRFGEREDRQSCAGIAETFESDGPLMGFRRLFEELNYPAPPHAWLDALMQIPGMKQAVDDVLRRRADSGAPPLTMAGPAK